MNCSPLKNGSCCWFSTSETNSSTRVAPGSAPPCIGPVHRPLPPAKKTLQFQKLSVLKEKGKLSALTLTYCALPGFCVGFLFPGFLRALKMSSSFTLFSQRHLHIVSFVARLTIGFSLTSVAEVWFTGTAISSLSMGREVLRGQISLKTVEFVRSLPSFSSSPSFSAFPPLEVTKMVQITRARQQRPIQVITTVFFLKPKHGPSSAILAQNGGPSEEKKAQQVIYHK